ncbi:nuclear transport factor 2 family protein [Aggregatilinea lenta]|uniref:nuclear transport factor 2 family protein n=1 Tax=Aggregatilinea lenta TaxID=913108 RepID=UPI000E5A338C|nr:nuclear transport factor 2 family protein [Aggregatilinea lenta]
MIQAQHAHVAGSDPDSAVRAVLQRFQDGYTRRDPGALDAFLAALFVPDDELLVIGTGAGEWCYGREEVRTLIESDWLQWGDVELDVRGAVINVLGDVAWVATQGAVASVIGEDAFYQSFLSGVYEHLDSDTLSPQDKVLEIARGVTNVLFETARGDTYIWPFRFTAVLVRRNGRWLFHQIQFSFPTTRVPDLRLAE